jgi:hypothetical protein
LLHQSHRQPSEANTPVDRFKRRHSTGYLVQTQESPAAEFVNESVA